MDQEQNQEHKHGKNQNDTIETYHCYVLRSLSHDNSTYIGMTNNPSKRLRQHNGEIVGGARATQSKRPYEMFCIISGFNKRTDALSYEWHFKHPIGRKQSPKYHGIKGRIESIKKVLEDKPYHHKLTIKISNNLAHFFDTYNQNNIEIIKID